MVKARVLVADDHGLLRAGLRLLINSQCDLEVVGEAGNISETLDSVRRLTPDILTLDLSMPGGSSVKLIDRLVRDFPKMHILVLTMHDDAAYVRAALAAGAVGYVVKQALDSQILTAIRTVIRGGVYAQIDSEAGPPRNRQACPADSKPTDAACLLDALSAREREVLEWVAQGYTSQAIAERLFLSVKTVESYRARLMAKLGLRNRADLTRLALEIGLLTAEPISS